MDVTHFYEKSQDEIVALFRRFIEEDLFVRYPQLRDKVSVIITGSVPAGHYDQYSDIDCEFFYVEESERELMNAIVKEYKQSIRDRKLPIQFHPAKTFVELQKEHLAGWEHDDSLREYSIALSVLDPKDRYEKIRSAIQWYPQDVLVEKLNWLFAEAVFHFEDRFAVAVKRDNVLYAYAVRSHIIKLLGNALLMKGGHWPVFEKHLATELVEFGEKDFFLCVKDLLATSDMEDMEKKLKSMIKSIEKRLVRKGGIEKRSAEEWTLLRPKYQVEHCR